MKLLPITGNTYPVKDSLKALGCRWDGQHKVWMAPEDVFIQAQNIVAQAPKKGYSTRGRPGRYGSRYTRFNSGAEVWTNKNGRCEDAPCCGCCS